MAMQIKLIVVVVVIVVLDGTFIGRETINTPGIFSGVHGFTG